MRACLVGLIAVVLGAGCDSAIAHERQVVYHRPGRSVWSSRPVYGGYYSSGYGRAWRGTGVNVRYIQTSPRRHVFRSNHRSGDSRRPHTRMNVSRSGHRATNGRSSHATPHRQGHSQRQAQGNRHGRGGSATRQTRPDHARANSGRGSNGRNRHVRSTAPARRNGAATGSGGRAAGTSQQRSGRTGNGHGRQNRQGAGARQGRGRN